MKTELKEKGNGMKTELKEKEDGIKMKKERMIE